MKLLIARTVIVCTEHSSLQAAVDNSCSLRCGVAEGHKSAALRNVGRAGSRRYAVQ